MPRRKRVTFSTRTGPVSFLGKGQGVHADDYHDPARVERRRKRAAKRRAAK